MFGGAPLFHREPIKGTLMRYCIAIYMYTRKKELLTYDKFG